MVVVAPRKELIDGGQPDGKHRQRKLSHVSNASSVSQRSVRSRKLSHVSNASSVSHRSVRSSTAHSSMGSLESQRSGAALLWQMTAQMGGALRRRAGSQRASTASTGSVGAAPPPLPSPFQ